MAKRRSFIANRFQKMRGLPQDEKELLVRIGQTIDGAINNRGPTNPTMEENIKIGRADPKLPPVKNITVKRGVLTVTIEWDAPDSSRLLFFRLEFQHKETGTKTTKDAFENKLIFKGDPGEYRVFIKAIGRNQVSSAIREVTLTVPDHVMFLEGAKNDVETISTIVSESVYVPKGYTVFAWCAFTLNAFTLDAENDVPTVVFKRSLKTETISQAITIQSQQLFRQSGTATSFSDEGGVGGGSITRPTVISGSPDRSGNNETSQTLMFTPLELDDSLTGQDYTFYVSIEDRNQLDIKGLSIVLWVATGGRGFVVTAPDIFTGHTPSVKLVFSGLEGNIGKTVIDDNNVIIGNRWSFSCWFKVEDLDASLLSTGSMLMNIKSVLDLGGGSILSGANGRFLYLGKSGGTYFLGARAENPDGTNTQGIRQYQSTTKTDLFPLGDNKWHFIAATWDGTVSFGQQRLKVYMNGVELTGDASEAVTTDLTNDIAQTLGYDPGPGVGDDWVHVGGTQIDTFEARGHVKNEIVHNASIWNLPITAGAISTLYNGGLDGGPGSVDYTVNSGNYTSSANLQFLWRFGNGREIGFTNPTVTNEGVFPFGSGIIYITDGGFVGEPPPAIVVDDHPGDADN